MNGRDLDCMLSRLGVSQKKLSLSLGVAYMTVYRWINSPDKELPKKYIGSIKAMLGDEVQSPIINVDSLVQKTLTNCTNKELLRELKRRLK